MSEKWLGFVELIDEIKQLEQHGAEQIFELLNSWRDKGRQEKKRKITIEMIKEGASIDFIEKVTKLTREEVEKLQQNL